ncbi:MAG: hypothetical protein ACI4UT_01125 [Candidatus Enteromonas sp.]
MAVHLARMSSALRWSASNPLSPHLAWLTKKERRTRISATAFLGLELLCSLQSLLRAKQALEGDANLFVRLHSQCADHRVSLFSFFSWRNFMFDHFEKTKKTGTILLGCLFAAFCIVGILILFTKPSDSESISELASRLSLIYFCGFVLTGLFLLVLGLLFLQNMEMIEKVRGSMTEKEKSEEEHDQGF